MKRCFGNFFAPCSDRPKHLLFCRTSEPPNNEGGSPCSFENDRKRRAEGLVFCHLYHFLFLSRKEINLNKRFKKDQLVSHKWQRTRLSCSYIFEAARRATMKSKHSSILIGQKIAFVIPLESPPHKIALILIEEKYWEIEPRMFYWMWYLITFYMYNLCNLIVKVPKAGNKCFWCIFTFGVLLGEGEWRKDACILMDE